MPRISATSLHLSSGAQLRHALLDGFSFQCVSCFRRKTFMDRMSAMFLRIVFTYVLSAYPQANPPLKVIQTIPMPGVEGRIDHLNADVKGQRLFVAALGNNTLEVLDLAQGKRIRSVTGLREPQGVAYVAELDQVVVANGDDGTVRIF